jgi:hypothetical protein
MGPPLAFKSRLPTLGVGGADRKSRNPGTVFDNKSEIGLETGVGAE